MEGNERNWLAAGDLEYRLRPWIIAAIFFAAFELYQWDHVRAAGALAGWLTPSGGNVHATETLIFGAGAAMALAAAALRTWAAAYMSSSVVHDPRVHDSRLVADGPYRYLRNPLYLGVILIAWRNRPGGQPRRFCSAGGGDHIFSISIDAARGAGVEGHARRKLSPLPCRGAAHDSKSAAARAFRWHAAAVGSGIYRRAVHVGLRVDVCAFRRNREQPDIYVGLHWSYRPGVADGPLEYKKHDETNSAVSCRERVRELIWIRMGTQ